MCRHHGFRSPLLCILPPHVLEHLAERASGPEREAARKTLAQDQALRAARTAAMAELPARRHAGVRAAAATPQKSRTVYDARQATRLPGTRVRSEGHPATGDVAVDEAYDGLGATFDFFWENYARNSIDDAGMPLKATVHYGRSYDNAFWNGSQMVFGDGDGQYFNRFTIALDVIGHELAHGVTADEAGLVYSNQSGALNESLSDVFGVLVKQYQLKQTAAEADWLIGAGLFTDAVNGVALRSMRAPGTAYDDPVLGKDPQPDHMRKFVRTTQDNGGVHINSGIPNRAFYLAAVALGGYAWEKAGRIWYRALLDSRLRTTSGFLAFGRLTWDHAKKLYGTGSSEAAAVKDAWNQVGLKV